MVPFRSYVSGAILSLLAACSLAAARSAPPPHWRLTVPNAESLVTRDFLLVFRLPAEAVAAFAQAVGRDGYQLVRLRPYRQGGTVQVAGLWRRGKAESHSAIGLSSAQLLLRNEELRKRGFSAVDLAGCPSPEGNRFTAVWTRSRAEEAVRLVVGVEEARHESLWKELIEKKFVPVSLHRFRDNKGVLRCSGVWKRGKEPGPSVQFWWGGERFVLGKVGEFGTVRLLTDANLSSDGASVQMVGVWGEGRTRATCSFGDRSRTWCARGSCCLPKGGGRCRSPPAPRPANSKPCPCGIAPGLPGCCAPSGRSARPGRGRPPERRSRPSNWRPAPSRSSSRKRGRATFASPTCSGTWPCGARNTSAPPRPLPC